MNNKERPEDLGRTRKIGNVSVRPVWMNGNPPEMTVMFFVDDVHKLEARELSNAIRTSLEAKGYIKTDESPKTLKASEGISFAVTYPPDELTDLKALTDFQNTMKPLELRHADFKLQR